MRLEFENVSSPELENDPVQVEISNLVRRQNMLAEPIDTKTLVGGLLQSIRRQDAEFIGQKPLLDEIFTFRGIN